MEKDLNSFLLFTFILQSHFIAFFIAILSLSAFSQCLNTQTLQFGFDLLGKYKFLFALHTSLSSHPFYSCWSSVENLKHLSNVLTKLDNFNSYTYVHIYSHSFKDLLLKSVSVFCLFPGIYISSGGK